MDKSSNKSSLIEQGERKRITPDQAIAKALRASKKKNSPVALKRWSRVLKLLDAEAPAETYKYMAIAYRHENRIEDAEAIIEKGLRYFPDDLGISVEAAELAMSRRDWKRAVKMWNDVVAVAPKPSRSRDRALMGLHLCYAALGDFNRAYSVYLALENGDTSRLPNLDDQETRHLFNLLTYTKTSGSRYAARRAPAGYQTIKIKNVLFEGARRPEERYQVIPLNFNGKSVLDIGSNQGGMLFHKAQEISWGVGLDYDPKMVNVANRIRQVQNYPHLNFYTFDLDKEPVDLIRSFLPAPRVDYVLLLRVIGWLQNPAETLRIIAELSNTLVFQNHRNRRENLALVREYFKNVRQCTDHKADPNIRDIYVCTND